ncbi:MAG: tRNA threonylcarbamoyladenosine dehydratase [Bacteroidales bacterium]|nr:tRNA threonylcarbamoyladenosine dehydratase [Bacteroidales bacterium]
MLKHIASKRVIVFGVGGVGGWCAESLVRSGISDLTIVDCDNVCITNINRQLVATHSSIGRPKVEVLKERLLDINPQACINAVLNVYNPETSADFHLEDYDYVIDCIDSLKNKIHLLVEATKYPRPKVFSSMGAGLKIDPTQIRVAEFWKVRGCPLGSMMRKRMRQRKTLPSRNIMCVYSEELLENRGSHVLNCQECGRECPKEAYSAGKQASVNGTLSYIVAIFGFTLAGLVIKDIIC